MGYEEIPKPNAQEQQVDANPAPLRRCAPGISRRSDKGPSLVNQHETRDDAAHEAHDDVAEKFRAWSC